MREQESEKSPPGLDEPSDARQQRTEEEIQMDDEDDKKWGLEARVRAIDTRLRRVEERIYDEGVSGQASAQEGQDADEGQRAMAEVAWKVVDANRPMQN